MPTNRKPDDERTRGDYQRSADNSIELAKVLAGEGVMSDQDFLQRMARSDVMVDHACGGRVSG